MKNTFYINIDSTNYRAIHEDGMYIVFSLNSNENSNYSTKDVAATLEKDLICKLTIQNGRLKFLRTFDYPILFVDIHNTTSKDEFTSNENSIENNNDIKKIFDDFLLKNLKDHETHPKTLEIDSIIYFKPNTVKFFVSKMRDFKIFSNDLIKNANSIDEAIKNISDSKSNQYQIKFKVINQNYRPNSYNCKEDENIILDLHLNEVQDENQLFNSNYFNDINDQSKSQSSKNKSINISDKTINKDNKKEKPKNLNEQVKINNCNKDEILPRTSFASNEKKICKVKVKDYKEIYDNFTNPNKKSNSHENLKQNISDVALNQHKIDIEKNNRVLKCTICMEKFDNKVSLKPCQHEYCFECIDNWKKNSTACPICKVNFTQILSKTKILCSIKKVKKFHYKDDDIEEEQEWYDNLLQYCMECKKDEDAENMLVCDTCNKNVCHYYCDNLKSLPNLNEPWNCSECRNKNSKTSYKSKTTRYNKYVNTMNESSIDESSIEKREKLKSKNKGNKEKNSISLNKNKKLNHKEMAKRYSLRKNNNDKRNNTSKNNNYLGNKRDSKIKAGYSLRKR